ncbi:DHA2 family efflux MFS transporter permease subunit [Sphingomonas lenta]|uniref:DHA2 family efflux MFS transporter permease subunit n=1 Tax=Sphingomonas lenta TaxID=1141887 RepID=UPI001595D316|nr:DHA2 family efflux MFS transporter permease subunit [Sphingomonas lenta]
MADLPRSAAKPGVNPLVIAVLVSFGTLFEALNSTALSVALNTTAGNLGATAEESDGLITGYLVANAAVMPLSGWAATYFGRKPYFIFCVILFTLTSVLCAMAWSIESLLVFRVLQGAAAAGNASSESSIIADSFPPEKRGQGFAIYGMAVVVGPTLGPVFGGWATDEYSWTLIFWLNVPMGILAAIGCWLLIEDKPPIIEESKKRRAAGLGAVDWIGAGLAIVGLAALTIVLDQGQSEDWFGSSMITAATIVSVATLLILPFWERFRRDPILDFTLFRNPNFALSFVLLFGVGCVLFGGTSLYPLWLQQSFGYTATDAGLALGFGGLAVFLLMPAAGGLTGKVATRHLVAIGFSIMAVGLFMTVRVYEDYSFFQLSLVRIGQTIGVSMLFVPLQSHAFIGVPGRSSEQVAAFMNLARNLGGSVGTALGVTLLERNRQSYREDLVGYANPFRDEYAQAVEAYGGEQAFNRVIEEQATLLAYENLFFVYGVVALVGVLIAMMLRGKPTGKEQG